MIFIDLGGLSRSLEDRLQPGRRIDWFRLAKHLASGRRLAGAFVFDRAPGGEPGNPKRRFHDHLRYSGFRVVVRPTRPEERADQGEINVALVSEMLTAAMDDRFDTAIVVTVDRTLVPAIECLSQQGKVVEVAGLAGDLGPALRRVSDRMHYIDDLPVLEILPTNGTGRRYEPETDADTGHLTHDEYDHEDPESHETLETEARS